MPTLPRPPEFTSELAVESMPQLLAPIPWRLMGSPPAAGKFVKLSHGQRWVPALTSSGRPLRRSASVSGRLGALSAAPSGGEDALLEAALANGQLAAEARASAEAAAAAEAAAEAESEAGSADEDLLPAPIRSRPSTRDSDEWLRLMWRRLPPVGLPETDWPPPPLRSSVPGWWKTGEPRDGDGWWRKGPTRADFNAMGGWDSQHRQRTVTSFERLADVRFREGCVGRQQAFDEAVDALRGERYVTPPRASHAGRNDGKWNRRGSTSPPPGAAASFSALASRSASAPPAGIADDDEEESGRSDSFVSEDGEEEWETDEVPDSDEQEDAEPQAVADPQPDEPSPGLPASDVTDHVASAPAPPIEDALGNRGTHGSGDGTTGARGSGDGGGRAAPRVEVDRSGGVAPRPAQPSGPAKADAPAGRRERQPPAADGGGGTGGSGGAEQASKPKARRRKPKGDVDGGGPTRRAAPREPPWDISQSIWAPRAVWCDSKDFVDSDEVMNMRVACDWWRACAMGLERLVGSKASSRDHDGMVDELEDINACMREHRALYFGLFTYYASQGTDVCFMYLNQWSQFVDDFQLANNKSKNLRKADLDRLFIAVDTQAALKRTEIIKREASGGGRSPSPTPLHMHDDLKKKAFGRVEFLVALVHIAVLRYVETKKVPDVSEALHRLLAVDIGKRLNAPLFSCPNGYRTKYLYNAQVDRVLRKVEPSLQNLFHALCKTGGSGEKAKHLNLDEWRLLIRGLGLLDVDVTERDATMCFSWSRM